VQKELVLTLQSQIQSLEGEVHSAKQNLAVLKESHDSATTTSAAAAAIEHEALMKAKADLEAIAAETTALKSAQAEVLAGASEKAKELQGKIEEVEGLRTELAVLKSEKEQNANKISELEIEILELKESQETAEDERGASLARLKSLEEELCKATSATQQAIDDAKSKEGEHTRGLADVQKAHEDALKAAAKEQANVVADLEALRTELTALQAAHEQAKADARAAGEEHTRTLSEVETTHLGKQTEMSAETERIKAELEVTIANQFCIRDLTFIL
jgi:chromosome segregation ATPase